jgi:gliding motility-associated-like protein
VPCCQLPDIPYRNTSMRFLLQISISLLFLTPFSAEGQWDFGKLNTSPTDHNINAASFINQNEGWIICDSGRIYHTINGGTTWDDRSFAGVSVDGFDIEFKDNMNGWACGAFGMLLRTTTGGGTFDWTPVLIDENVIFKDVHMIDLSNGYICGIDTSEGAPTGALYKTTDGGVTWTYQAAPGGQGFYAIDIPDGDLSNVVVSGKNNHIVYSNNGGASWDFATTSGASLPNPMIWRSVYMYDGTFGMMVGTNHIYAETFDGGQSWTPDVSASIPGVMMDIDAIFGGTVFSILMCGNLGFTWSEDDGISWMLPSFSLTSDTLRDAVAINNTHAYVFGDDGVIYKSPAPPALDLAIENYLGPTSICGNGDFPVEIEIKNDGEINATAAVINVLDSDANLILSKDWVGDLPPGYTEKVYLGLMSVNSDETIQIEIIADDFLDNNYHDQDIDWIDPIGIGVDSPVRACGQNGVQLNAYGGTSYQWIQALEVSDSTIRNPWVYPSQTQTYFVAIKALWCFGTFDVLVEYVPECFEQTTIFTPNGDGTNDSFFVEGANPDAQSEFYIFSRWGNELIYIENYDNDDPEKSWKGQDRDNLDLPGGTYFFVYDNLDNGYQRKGWVQLLR